MRRAIALLISAILFVSMLVVGIAPKTQAQIGDPVTLTSPVLPVNETTERFDCFILNTGSSTVNVTIEVFSNLALSPIVSVIQTLIPGGVGVIAVPTSLFPPPGIGTVVPPGGYCKFTVPKGTFRASVDIVDVSTTTPKVLVALPAF